MRDGTGRLVLGALVDAAFLVLGVRVGWLTAGDILIAAWAQTAVPLVTVPVLLMRAASLAPDHPAVDAGKPVEINGKPLAGRIAARVTAVFFVMHFGLFMLVLGGFAFQFAAPISAGPMSAAGLGWLLLRAAITNVPSVIADARFLATDRFSQLASRATSVMGRPYLRMVPLHLGLLAGFIPLRNGPTWRLEAAAIAIVVTMTFVGSLWRYPTLAPLDATLPPPPRS